MVTTIVTFAKELVYSASYTCDLTMPLSTQYRGLMMLELSVASRDEPFQWIDFYTWFHD